MEYAKLKDEINKIKRTINRLRSKKVGLEKELGSLEGEKNEARRNYNNSYETKKREARQQHRKDLLLPFEQKRSAAQKALSDLESQHEEDLANLTVDNLMKNYSSKQEILQEVKESADELHKVIIEVVGQRFCDELESQLEVQEMKIEDENLDEMINYFNDCGTEIKKVSTGSSKLIGMINSVQNLIVDIDGSNVQLPTSAILGIAGVLIVIIFLCYKYVFPFYVLLLCILCVINLLRNYKVFKIILAQKTIRDNVDAIEERFRAEVLEEIERKTEEINEHFEKEKTALQSELRNINEEIERLNQTADRSFVFDEDSIRDIYNATIRQKELRESEISDSIHAADVEMQELYKKLDELNSELNRTIGDIQEQYLDYDSIGTSLQFDGKFIIDVVESKPIFFEHPKTSVLCLYQDEKVIADFIRLLNLQLRVKMSPTAYRVDVVDPTNLGRDYLCFKPVPKNDKEKASIGKLFRIIKNDGEYAPVVEENSELLSKRINTILSGHSDIEAYNEFMLSIDSLTEAYQFSFLLDPSSKTLTDTRMHQLLRNGSSVGMYYHLFIREDEFYSMGQGVPAILSNVGKFYVQTGSNIQSRAKDWLLEKIEEQKNMGNPLKG